MNKLSEKEAEGMTVNERLYLSGLLNAFDKAVEERDKEEVRGILAQLYLTPENIDAIILSEIE